MDELRYPIGRFNPAAAGSRNDQIETLRRLPERLRAAIDGLNDSQLDTPYREGGWTVRQLVHHIADSHANSYIRVKLALTEENPVITAYDEAAWARLPDSSLPIAVSLPFIDAVHTRLVSLLESMSEEDFQKTFRHPERGQVTLANNLAIYDWHCKHHTSHITRLRERMGW
ncbi:putative metal-dependent hydrolase [Acidobacteria bacterium AB60]|nr:putative metal-dependent hydrolase [Acidobacteria bacterium AB60]